MKINPEIIDQEQSRVLSVCRPAYQLKKEEVDVSSMVDSAQVGLHSLRRKAVAAAICSRAWHGEYPSLKTLNHLRMEYRSYSLLNGKPVEVFDPMTGAVNIPTHQLATLPLGEFFTPSRIRPQGGFTQLRGLTYYVALDPTKDTPHKKLEVMTRDVKEGLDLMDSVDRRSLDTMNYLLYLGILDHVKAHTLTAFHALTFHERTGVIPDDDGYKFARIEAEKLMVTATRAYHQTILGQLFDEGFQSAKIKEAFVRTADYIAGSGHSVDHFTYREVTQPVIIMLGAHEAARKKAFPDLIIGIPSGGTEVTVATHLLYETLYPNKEAPDMAFVPLSFHYRRQRGINSDRLSGILQQLTRVEGKRVLIVDDNSNTGLTLQTMAEATIAAGADDIAVHIAELDPARVEARFRKARDPRFPCNVLNMWHPDLQTAMGISWVSRADGSDLRRRAVGDFVREAYSSTE